MADENENKPDDRTVFERYIDVMKAVEPIRKAHFNETFKFSFRSIDDVYNALNDLLSDNGLFFTPHIIDCETENRESKRGDKALIYRLITVEYEVYGLKGDRLPRPIKVQGEAMDSGDRATSKAFTTAEKICLLTAFKIPTGDPSADPDSGKDQAKPAARSEPPKWRHNDRYRYGQGKDKPLTEGSMEYLANYAKQIAADLGRRPWATKEHLDAIHSEIEKREKAAADESSSPEESDLKCYECGGQVQGDHCIECGLVQSSPPD